MVLTIDDALELTFRDCLLDNNGKRWRVNGKVEVWKLSPSRLRVPLKHGLYSYDYLSEDNFDKEGVCHDFSLIDP